ncbi:hypothetical protein ACL9RL_10270 [Plantibacter sp. Mn2098]
MTARDTAGERFPIDRFDPRIFRWAEQALTELDGSLGRLRPVL